MSVLFGSLEKGDQIDAKDSAPGTDLLWNVGVGSAGSNVPLVVNSSSKVTSYKVTVPVFLTVIV